MAAVLLIEDDPQIARFASMTLRMEGHDPYVAINGEDGLVAAQQARPDLILLDLMLPFMDGMTVLRHLKADPTTAPIPVVIFSAAAWGDEERQARGLGAAGFLRKPAAAGELAIAVRDALGQG